MTVIDTPLSPLDAYVSARCDWLAREPAGDRVGGDLLAKRAAWTQWHTEGQALRLDVDGPAGYTAWLATFAVHPTAKAATPDLRKGQPHPGQRYTHGWVPILGAMVEERSVGGFQVRAHDGGDGHVILAVGEKEHRFTSDEARSFANDVHEMSSEAAGYDGSDDEIIGEEGYVDDTSTVAGLNVDPYAAYDIHGDVHVVLPGDEEHTLSQDEADALGDALDELADTAESAAAERAEEEAEAAEEAERLAQEEAERLAELAEEAARWWEDVDEIVGDNAVHMESSTDVAVEDVSHGQSGGAATIPVGDIPVFTAAVRSLTAAGKTLPEFDGDDPEPVQEQRISDTLTLELLEDGNLLATMMVGTSGGRHLMWSTVIWADHAAEVADAVDALAPRIQAAVTKALVADLVKVGPKGYIHGWIFVGVPAVGAAVDHPEHGSGKVTRHSKRTVGVRFDNGQQSAFEHAPETPDPAEYFTARAAKPAKAKPAKATPTAVARSVKSRTEAPKSYPQRSPIPDTKADWSARYAGYDPPEYTDQTVVDNDTTKRPAGYKGPKYWADPENPADVDREFTSYEGPVKLDDEGRPRNPFTRTGIQGRGLLGKWGANFAADPIVTRINPVTGQLEMATIQRGEPIGGVHQWAIPGGMVDEGEAVSATLAREFREETGADLDLSTGREIYRGYVDDPRNTDNAWMETTAVHRHLTTAEAAAVKFKGPDDPGEIRDIRWAPVDAAFMDGLYASHSDFVRQAIAEMVDDDTSPITPRMRSRLAKLAPRKKIPVKATPAQVIRDEKFRSLYDADGIGEPSGAVDTRRLAELYTKASTRARDDVKKPDALVMPVKGNAAQRKALREVNRLAATVRDAQYDLDKHDAVGRVLEDLMYEHGPNMTSDARQFHEDTIRNHRMGTTELRLQARRVGALVRLREAQDLLGEHPETPSTPTSPGVTDLRTAAENRILHMDRPGAPHHIRESAHQIRESFEHGGSDVKPRSGQPQPDVRRAMGRMVTAGGSVASLRLRSRAPRPDDQVVDTRDPRRLGRVQVVTGDAMMRVRWDDDGTVETRPVSSVTEPLRDPARSFDAESGERPRRMDAAVPATGPAAREIEVENRIREAYRDIPKRNEWVSLTALRERLRDIEPAEVDAALRRLGRGDYAGPGRPVLAPETDRTPFTQRDFDAAVRIGGQDKNLLSFDDPSPRLMPASTPHQRTAQERMSDAVAAGQVDSPTAVRLMRGESPVSIVDSRSPEGFRDAERAKLPAADRARVDALVADQRELYWLRRAAGQGHYDALQGSRQLGGGTFRAHKPAPDPIPDIDPKAPSNVTETAMEVHGRLNFTTGRDKARLILKEQPAAVLREIARIHGIVALIGGRDAVARMKKPELISAMGSWFAG